MIEVRIKEAGLQTKDGRMIMPGSKLLIKGAMPPAWNRVAEVTQQGVTERRLEVASPAPTESAPKKRGRKPKRQEPEAPTATEQADE